MAININDLGKNTPVKSNVEQQAQVKQQASQTSANVEQAKNVRQDSVSITPQAKQLGELQKKANDGPAIDQKKIAQIKQAIAAGQYKIDADKLAESLAGFEFKLS
ncbi:flagellar biosynthesis anti-sigma factor FlgM [Colwelliaceae bacterium 6471]